MSKFIRGNAECFSCGSSLLRRDITKDGRPYVHCFVCGAGECHLTGEETDGLDVAQVMCIAGREHGTNHQILPRVNTPGYTGSQTRFNEQDIQTITDFMEMKDK